MLAVGVHGGLLLVVLLASPGSAQVTERVSLGTTGHQAASGAELPSTQGRYVSSDGRYVVFESASSDVVPGDVNGTWDIFLRDRVRGTTHLISISTAGVQGNGVSGLFGLTITPDGRFVVFESRASNLVPGDTNLSRDVFLRDRSNGTTERVSLAMGGGEGNDESFAPSVSADARFVAFISAASNLVPGDTNNAYDVFVCDRLLGTTERVSVAGSGVQGNFGSDQPSISADGRWVAFQSESNNLVPGDTNGVLDIFLRDRLSGTTERASVPTGGGQGDQGGGGPVISSDGRFIAFTSFSTNLVPGDTNGDLDVFVHDRRAVTTERVSVATGGIQGNSNSSFPAISADGRFVAFSSAAHNLVSGGTIGANIFVRDRALGTTELVSVSTSGAQSHYGGLDSSASISEDGRYTVFKSYNRDLVPGDSNGHGDVFLHDSAAAGFGRLCEAGTGGVVACPCSNPASGSELGCDNSAQTGGASLSASGIAYLSMDSLVFTAGGETQNAASILLQGNSFAGSGIPYGQGVRCVGGTMQRLFTKTAVAGGITAPDFGAGDPQVSARSAALGDVILAGQSRWYLVYYRDPIVLGGCSASSTFNATQTGQVTWWP
jgi:Tol biopolymer transport system component